jgi:hypothetical protein
MTRSAMRNLRRGNQVGIASLVLTLLFWVYVYSGIGTDSFRHNPYVIFVVLPGTLVLTTLLSILAAFVGSKWWLVVLVGPAFGAMLLLSASG